ncbi:MAG: phospholipid carrier-dependent glycosyltransferase [Anaerolineae bacterium]
MTDKKNIIAVSLILVAAFASSALVYWATTHGTGISIDSVVYIETALGVKMGQGFTQWGNPATHFPPVYPALIAFSNALQPGMVYPSTRLLHVALMGINTVLMGLALRASARNSVWAVLVGLTLFLFSFPILENHVMAWSEPPFLTFMLAGFCLLALYFRKGQLVVLALAAFAMGLAAVTRYIGATLIPPLLLTLWVLSKNPPRKKWGEVITAGAAAITPLAIWGMYNTLRASQATDRTFAVHLITSQHIYDFIRTMSNYILPGILSFNQQLVFLGLVCALFGLGLFMLKQKKAFTRARAANLAIPLMALLFVVVYVPFLAVSISFFDNTTPVDSRILLPVYVALILAAVALTRNVARATHKPIIALAFLALLPASAFLNARVASTKLGTMQKTGWGYGATQWTDSPTYAAAHSITPGTKIYSNGFDHINFQMEAKRSAALPLIYDGVTKKQNEGFDLEMRVMCDETVSGKAAVVFYNAINDRPMFPDQKQFTTGCPTARASSYADGVIFAAK